MKRLLILLFIPCLFACERKSNGQSAVVARHQFNKEAVKLVKQATDTVMKSSDANRNQAIVAAIGLLEKAIAIDSSYLSAYRDKLRFQMQLKQYQNAILTGKQLIKLRPLNDEFYGSVGFMYEKIGDTISSKRYFGQSLLLLANLLDTMKTSNNRYKSLALEKALVLTMLGHEQQGKAIYKKFYDIETDTIYKQALIKYMNMGKKDWLALFDNDGHSATSTNATKPN